jgi:hypothetical protein
MKGALADHSAFCFYSVMSFIGYDYKKNKLVGSSQNLNTSDTGLED